MYKDTTRCKPHVLAIAQHSTPTHFIPAPRRYKACHRLCKTHDKTSSEMRLQVDTVQHGARETCAYEWVVRLERLSLRGPALGNNAFIAPIRQQPVDPHVPTALRGKRLLVSDAQTATGASWDAHDNHTVPCAQQSVGKP